MPAYKIKPLPLSKMQLDMGFMTYVRNYGTKKWLGVYTWYIEGGDKHILVDTGADAEFISSYRGLPAEEIMSFEDALATVSLQPADIDLVIQTHLHYDHCGKTKKCKNAKVVVQEQELNFALSPHPIMAVFYYKPFYEDIQFTCVKGACEIEPGIDLIPVPGHTPGAQAVSVDTDEGKVTISGFCCIKENFELTAAESKIWPVLTPGYHTSAVDSFDSAVRIKEMGGILIPQHDLSFSERKTIP